MQSTDVCLISCWLGKLGVHCRLQAHHQYHFLAVMRMLDVEHRVYESCYRKVHVRIGLVDALGNLLDCARPPVSLGRELPYIPIYMLYKYIQYSVGN